MKKLLLATLLITTAVCCKKTPGKLLTGRWEFKDAYPVYTDSANIDAEVPEETGEENSVADFSSGECLATGLFYATTALLTYAFYKVTCMATGGMMKNKNK